MSKLLDLFNGSQYARLNTISGGNKNFSVRNQSNTNQEIRQGNAVDFFSNTYQSGFEVNRQSLSVQGFRKSDDTQTSKFTGNTTGLSTTENNAFESYNRFANDASRNKYNSKLIHKYLATDTTKQYATIMSAGPGLTLTYNV
jgi:hypothetical protein